MIAKKYNSSILMMLLTALLLMNMSGCLLGRKTFKPAGPVTCSADISWEVPDETEITMFDCYMDTYKKKNSIHFTIALKNLSNKPLRYRVNIFIPDGGAVGGLLPREGNPPYLQPGEESRITYPIKNYAKIPRKLDIVIRTIEWN